MRDGEDTKEVLHVDDLGWGNMRLRKEGVMQPVLSPCSLHTWAYLVPG